ncbi:MAG TPA: glycosyltransferase family 4 protein [Thermoanaerobaculia bacterium]|nr:glycosyltransferase family 4 protein [Thermoanaerobaculia bacterium]
MERLTVLQVAYPLARVGPDAVGGAEQVIGALDSSLVRAGHLSLVIACEGSSCAGTLLLTPRWERFSEAVWGPAHRAHRQAIGEALRGYDVDLVHLHGVDFNAYLPPPGPPALVTVHLPKHQYPGDYPFPDRPKTWYGCVSASQRRTFPPDAPLLDPIPNGVDLNVFHPRSRKRAFALSLGRVCPEKGFHLALEAAKSADLPLALGGEVFPYPNHQRYFAEEIQPRLDAHRRFLGPLDLRRKARLLAAACCLVIASQIDETSSLVAMEALASGTPVIAFPAGAVSEIVEDGRTGFLVHDVNGIAAALRRVPTLDPQECRRVAEERFPVDRMARRYLDLYRRLAAGDLPWRSWKTPALSSVST